MDKLFLGIINMSITSTYVILFIIVARFFLKRAPKIFSYGLWGIAFLRLIIPFSFESIFSLISINTKTIPENIIYTPTPQIQSGIRLVDGAVNRLMPSPPPIGASVNPIQIHIFIGSAIWVTGLVALLIYSIVTTIKLSKGLKPATFLYDNIYQIDNIKTPFVFGLINPKIYLPYNLSKTEETYIIRHEQTHIKRKDNIIKFVTFLIVCIHWFNPFAWLAFYLMSEDMELSCDESVIKEMGYSIKKDYSSSLLSLSVGRKIIGGSPIAFGENNTKGRIKNILNYKRPKFWVVVIAIVAVIALAVGLLSNPLDNGKVYKDENKSVEDYAWQYIDEQIAMYESFEQSNIKIVDKKISKLEKLSSFNNILSSPVELWILEYRLKPENVDEVMLAGGMEMVDGWITEDDSTGKPHLIFTYENNNLTYLGNSINLESGMDTLVSQEVAIRITLENRGLLPNETYEGNHVVIKFPLSTGEIAKLLLSQPIIQGNNGIWVVERWIDGNGIVYHEIPNIGIDGNSKIRDYYKALQDESFNEPNYWLLDPIEVGYNHIIDNLGQILVKKEDLAVINPATVDDFLTTDVNITIGQSAKFTEEEIMEAIYTVKNNFTFPAATLTKILYYEEKSDSLIKTYLNYGRSSKNGVKPENIIILLSEFDVDGSGDNPVLNPDSTYENYQWVLIRDDKESNWIIDDRGY